VAYEYLQQRGASTAYDPDSGGALTRFERRVNSVRAGIDARKGRIGCRRTSAGTTTRTSEVRPPACWPMATTSIRAGGCRRSWPPRSARRASTISTTPISATRPVAGAVAQRRAGAGLRRRQRLDAHRRLPQPDHRPDRLRRHRAAGAQRRQGRHRRDRTGRCRAAAGWQLQADASYTRAEDSSRGERLLRRAPWKLHLAAARGFGRFDGLFEVTYSARRYDADITPSPAPSWPPTRWRGWRCPGGQPTGCG